MKSGIEQNILLLLFISTSNITLSSLKSVQLQTSFLLFNPLSFSKLEILTLKKVNDLWKNLEFAYIKGYLLSVKCFDF